MLLETKKKGAFKMTNENQENLPAVLESTLPAITGDSIFTDMARFELAQRVAKALSVSSIVPRDFQGNIGNCLIAQNLAGRMEVDVFMLMQSMYIVHGRPGVEGKLIIALINKSGMFKGPLRFEFGEDRKSCRAVATFLDGNICEGPLVTWAMVVAEMMMKRLAIRMPTRAPAKIPNSFGNGKKRSDSSTSRSMSSWNFPKRCWWIRKPR